MAHRAIDCPFSWYQDPATHLYAEASDANANNQPVNPDNPADEQTNIVNEDSPALIADPDGTPDSLAYFTAPVSALSASGTSSSSSGSSSSATDISNDDSHLSEPSQAYDMSKLTDVSLVLAAAQSSHTSQFPDASSLHPPASGLLDPDGFIVSSDASIVRQSHGPSVLMSDLAVSDEDGECLSDTRDPLSSADPLAFITASVAYQSYVLLTHAGLILCVRIWSLIKPVILIFVLFRRL